MSANKTFYLLWLGQLISNFGTQISFYGIGLWLFSISGNIKDFALVAIIVQLARLSFLPFITKIIKIFPRKKLMIISCIFGAFCTLAITFILLSNSLGFNLYLLLLAQGFAATADAIMIISFSSLIPVLVTNTKELKTANGLFASTDNLILTISPFLGSWLSGLVGIKGILLCDCFSFFLAIAFILRAPFSSKLVTKINLLQQENRKNIFSIYNLFKKMWDNSNSFYFIFVLTISISYSYASTEILFPAWIATAYGTSRMGNTLIIAIVGYLLGLACWNFIPVHSLKKYLFISITIQSLILMGSGLIFFENKINLWMLAVFSFSLLLPIVTSNIQHFWCNLTPKSYLTDIFAIRYAGEWSSRILSFLLVSFLVNNFIKPFLFHPNLPIWMRLALGNESGREIAVSLGLTGWLLIVGMIVSRRRRCNLKT